ncbi:MAG: hypothetical protein WCI51_09245 [Lentisphaerota bacterium]
MKKSHSILFVAGAGLFTFISGCQEGPDLIVANDIKHSERNSQAVVLDTSLMPGWFEEMLNQGKLSFENNRSASIAGNTSREVYAEIRNRAGNKDLLVEISTSFRAQGIVVDESRWEKFKLTPNQTLTYKSNSLKPADAYCVRIRQPNQDTNSINGAGINLMSDKMLRSLVRCPAIYKSQKPLRIALHQFDNRTGATIDESIFPSKLRAEANSRLDREIIFVSRRVDVIDAVNDERSKKRDGELADNKDRRKEKLSGVDYFLTGKLQTVSGNPYWLFTYQLVDAENSDIIWEDQFEIGNF